MKKLLLIFAGLLLIATLSACNTDTQANNEKEEPNTEVISNDVQPEATNQDPEPQSEDSKFSGSDSPHQFSGFTKDEDFTGGQEVKDYNLNNVRRGPHPNFTRLIFDFSVGSQGNEAAIEPPKYKISYNDSEKTVTAVFTGVRYNSLANKVKEIKQLAPIIEDIKFKATGNELKMSLILKENVQYQVFPLSNPARIAIVINPSSDIQ